MEEKKDPLLNKNISSGCGPLGFMLLYIFVPIVFPSFIRGNIYARFGFSRMELGPIMGPIVSILLFIFGSLVLFSYGLIALEIFWIDLEEIPNGALKPFQQRKKNCKPWLIGILVGLVSPLLVGLIYAIRHKDWKIVVYPLWIFFSLALFVIPPDIEIMSYGIYLRLFSGVIAYLIVRKNKLSIKIEENKDLIT